MHSTTKRQSTALRVALTGRSHDPARVRYERPAEELVRYLVFADEAPLVDEVKGTSGFEEEFASRGPRDSRGRSLRDFDLRTRLFKYPVSYLIYTDAFDALPEPAKTYVYHRLFEILSGSSATDGFGNITSEDRLAALEIVRETKPGLPDESEARRKATPRRPSERYRTEPDLDNGGACPGEE